MEKYQVIKLLEFYPKIPSEISLYLDWAKRYEDEYCALQSPPIDDMPKGGGISDSTGKLAIFAASFGYGDDLQWINNHIEALQVLQNEMFNEIKRLPCYQKQVIYYYYLDGRQWAWIARAIGYSEKQCRNIRWDAILNIGKRFEQNTTIKEFKFL